ncbi:uncharacterized protein DNG_07383 [Cephalotrichum gorgonifer]|uniref:Uncharacterized protein n=1 Tax=Cephalotrichum gorgonifer TaxID=2041049 RepID=A0AAE8N3D8_9PEZI|nr:uncharacterized protein DNG_07383 [Cephalotrichum gorgonifer]
MSEANSPNDYDSGADDWETNSTDSTSDLDYASVKVGLDKTGERGSGYHTRNDPSAPYQRPTVTERRGIIEVRCKSREIVHGFLSADGEEKSATLLVYDLHLDTTRRSRRIISASLDFEFASSEPGGRAPEVHSIAPAGRVTLLPSTQDESTTSGGGLEAGAGPMGVNIGGSVKWEKTVTRTTGDDARVGGYIFSDDYGRGVGASWDLYENKSVKSGVPSFLRCAILLDRGDDAEGEFECRVRIKAEADWKTEMGRLFGSTPGDDPLLFDPTLPPTNKLRKEGYDVDNLGSLDLDDFVDIVFGKAFKRKKESA